MIVHSSLSSFGHVDGGADAVVDALLATCGTLLLPGATSHATRVPAPPDLVRENNASPNVSDWASFDAALAEAADFHRDLPINRNLGVIPETLRRTRQHVRSWHPWFSYIAAGAGADDLIAQQRLDWPLGPIEALTELGGQVLLLGVSHTTNTTIHLGEQLLGRARFYRYAKAAPGVWMELPNIPGASHRFDDIEPHLRSSTRRVSIGACTASLVSVADVLAVTRHLIEASPSALLCDDPACQCAAAIQQRLRQVRVLAAATSGADRAPGV
ncbi:AAC(3) family N-acetyltransferase [Kribbella solani]|uniref:Aminoglycoside N(3)-acetyltransferase n=1 Tax=Kribbella solani TaxID=236067 RepID=A0A841DZL8_9ACTN|nr:aminoglycoside 3-N-acetyltransferase [Kribbella solani]